MNAISYRYERRTPRIDRCIFEDSRRIYEIAPATREIAAIVYELAPAAHEIASLTDEYAAARLTLPGRLKC
jgi:hypothetical protein